MNSISKRAIKSIELLVSVFVIVGLLFPPATLVMAQDENPPAPAQTGEEAAPPAEENPQAPVEELPPADLPPEQTVEPPAETPAAEVIPVEQTVEAPAPDATEEAIAAPPEPAPAPEEAAEEQPTETIDQIVAVLDETNTVLVDENNEEIPLASEEAAAALEGGDPFFLDGLTGAFIGYTSGGSCPSFVTECHTGEAAPFTAALNDARLTEYSTLYIEAATYNEPDIYVNRNLSLQGGTGWYTTGSGATLTVGYTNAVATINHITIGANMGYFSNVVANDVFVNGTVAASDTERGAMLDDALWVVNTGGTITVADGTYQDEGDGFLIEKNGVTLQGQGDNAVINGSNTGFGINIDDYIGGTTLHDVSVRRIKVIGSGTGIQVGDATNLTFDRLTLTGNGTGLRASEYAGTSQIHNSIILGNTNYGLYNASTSVIDATGNYWGHSQGPTFCWDVGGTVTCDPTKKGDYVYLFDTANPTVLTGGYLSHVVCPPGHYDTNSDGVCDVVTCPAGSYDANSDGLCEPTVCPAGSFDANADGACEHTTCPAGRYDANSDGACEVTVCAAGSFDANSDGVCETTVCPAGRFDSNSDGLCEATGCAAGTYDANSDGLCEPTVCPAGSYDANSDGACEHTTCAAGSFDANSDGVCEHTTCAAGTFDANSDGACEATVCLPGRFDANSDGVCEVTACPTGTNDANSDGQCEITTCAPGTADIHSDGTCVPTVCAMLTFDANSDGICEQTACAAGSADVNSDGACEVVTCSAGHYDVDSDNVCEAVGCPRGSYDANSDGACEPTICPDDRFDANSDGLCEADYCNPGSADLNSDGYCEQTVCTGGKFDADSDGVCEDVGFTPLPLPALYGVLGAGAVIPVTGELSELSCTEANTLVLPSGTTIAFSAPLCGYMAGMSEPGLDALPGALPSGMTFVAGTTLIMQKDAKDVAALPSPVTGLVSFTMPEDQSGKTLVILAWDAAAGAWVEVSGAASGQAAVAGAGTYVLAYK